MEKNNFGQTSAHSSSDLNESTDIKKFVVISVTSKESPNVCKSCPKMISLEKLKILTPLQKLPKNVGDLGKLLLPKALKRCPKSNKFPNLVTLLAINAMIPLSLSLHLMPLLHGRPNQQRTVGDR